MIAIGIGSTTAATVAQVKAALLEVAQMAGIAADVVATLSRGGAERTIITAAMEMGVECCVLPAVTLVARNANCVTHGPASWAAYGIASVAEAAALAAAGPRST